MKEFEQVKIFKGTKRNSVEDQYNEWVREQEDLRSTNPVLAGLPLQILDRQFTVRLYEGEETVFLSIFYKHRHLEPHEQGNVDRGAGGGGSVSMMGGRGRR
jgi:hypothetical protein